MSQVDELLNTLSDEGSVEGGNIVIGNDRFITIPDSLKKLAVQYDHNITTVTFDCPRYWNGIDLSKMKVYVNFMRPDGVLGMHHCDNVSVDPVNTDIMHFDWPISGYVTYEAGPLSFLVCIKKLNSEGLEENHWNSEVCIDAYVSPGMKCQETVLRRYPDIITQLLSMKDEVNETLAGIQALGIHYHDNKEVLDKVTELLITLDPTLTKGGQPADAKAVGDAIETVAESVDTLGKNMAKTVEDFAEGITEELETHTGNSDIHVTAEDKTYWNNKVDSAVTLWKPDLPPVGTAMNDMSWVDITNIEAAGLAAEYFTPGDKKTIHVEGTIGTLAVNFDTNVVVLEVGDHNGEGKGIVFGCFMDDANNNLALSDSVYRNYVTNGSVCFNINHSTLTNAGGWTDSDIRYDILGSSDSKSGNASVNTAINPVANTFMSALPEDLRAVMQPITKSTVDGSGAVDVTVDYLPLLSEYEIYGVTTHGNTQESTIQKQYAYYANGGSKVRKNPSGSAVYWWTRTPDADDSESFVIVNTDGTAGSTQLSYSYGLAPIFLVGGAIPPRLEQDGKDVTEFVRDEVKEYLPVETSLVQGSKNPVESGVLFEEINQAKRSRLIYYTESTELTIPEGVTIIDVYLVNGGEDGKAATERSLENGWCGGGYGGAGGGCFFLPGIRVTPGETYDIIVGAAGGGTTYFGGYGADGLVTAGGTVGSSSNTRGDRTLRVGAFPMLYGQLNGGICPLDGQIYGVSGAAGGVSYASQANNYTLTAGAGGDKAVVNAEKCIPPQGGYDGNIGYLEYGSSADNFAGGGGGGSFDNTGQDGKASTKAAGTYRAGAGANATTYGCGGGGGAGGFTTLMRGGAGGKGAQGVCIIAY